MLNMIEQSVLKNVIVCYEYLLVWAQDFTADMQKNKFKWSKFAKNVIKVV